MSVKAWSDEDAARLIQLYDEGFTVDELAKVFGKGYRSVISKLVQLRIYRKPDSENQRMGETVKEMLIYIEQVLDIEIEGTNLNKKSNLVTLVEAIRQKFDCQEAK